MQPITPELLILVDAIARHGSFAKAARELGKVPSAVTYSIRKLEDGLDVLLFDRSGHRALLTPAGEALLKDGRHVLQSLDDLACRVKRIATGWEVELRIAVSAVLPWRPLYDLIDEFQTLESATTLRFSSEVLSGNWDALTSGRADLVIGAGANAEPTGPYRSQAIGATQFGFCVAAHHPLASLPQPLSRADITKYCAVVVADTSRNLPPQSRGILADQPTLVMPSMQAKIDAQVRGLGCGYLPLTMAAPYLAQGLLVVCETDEGMSLTEHVAYAWRAEPPGEALKWWLQKLKSPRLCESLLGMG
ncbi:LysR family transcriptional regulator [Achromobacter marplatensis]|jgi:DNA-binding transcriptional LysR family regulator|uniref:DNA-binding transcriptional LysR family regulator n=1 Tax=Achromobacter marplatensis TaxID=470868 RepID=A0ABX9GIP6_9BURK|nr:LysR family transcriptional regulator [Achromobacter marplatensis]EJO33636.1 LysR family transcriptional regulator [Achromobacter marplatensis]OWT72291.1 LysR family transcriptional regulator [Achromobacter marplatensis]RBP24424.1 DNA-binding transcriptional LysR family regulator [Achromobacter marplatensis]CAB3626745.1 HTH-type transcriptional regulator YhaJ [Achromobacter marplatensis]